MRKLTSSNLSSKYFFLLFLCANFVGLFALFYHNQSNGLEATAIRLQQNLKKASDDLHQTAAQFSHIATPEFVSKATLLVSQGQIDGFRLYRNDSLISWSDNSVCFPILDNKHLNSGYVSVIGATHLFLEVVDNSPSKLYLFKKVYHQYPVENGFLQNGFTTKFSDGKNLLICKNFEGVPVRVDDKVLFFVCLKLPHSFWHINQWLILVWLLVLSVSLVSFLFSLSKRLFSRNTYRRIWVKVLIIFSVWLAAGSLLHLLSPLLLGDLFKPLIFASGRFNPNLAVLTLNIVFLLILALMWHRIEYKLSFASDFNRYAFIALVVILVAGGFRLMIGGFQLLIHNSNLPLDTSSIPLFNEYSLLIYALLFLLFLVWFLPAFSLLRTFDRFSVIQRIYSLLALTILTGISCIFLNESLLTLVAETICAALICSIILFRNSSLKISFTMPLPSQLLILGAAAFLASVLVTDSLSQKELAFRHSIAEKYLLDNQDRIAERHLLTLGSVLQSDTILRRMAGQFADQILTQDRLADYLHTHYFSGYLRRYTSEFTFCLPGDNLIASQMVQPVSCERFFREKSSSSISVIDSSMLWFFGYTPEHKGYLGRYVVPFNSGVLNVYAELVPVGVSRGIGMPEISGQFSSSAGRALQPYSYARYWDADLMSHAGVFSYWRQLPVARKSFQSDTLISLQKWSHLVIKAPGQAIVIISLPTRSWFTSISLFSYVFLGFSMLLLLGLLFVGFSSGHSLFSGSFRNRFQGTVFLLIFFSLVAIGISSVYFIVSLNERKNENVISDKAHSILIELQHQLPYFNNFQTNDTASLDKMLAKFSDVFFTDINLYSPQGYLIATSQPNAFEAGILAHYMDGDARRILIMSKESKLVHKETIGNLQFLSAYLPFSNSGNKVLAYLNLPAFSRQEELQAEIGSFLIAIINVYAIVLLIAAITGLVVARILTRPLQLLAHHLSAVKIGMSNRKIEWQGSDELAILISEYNRMLDELDSGAIEIKIKEREATWREMARQVAHEIKNPLTPLQLNVQYLQKAWMEEAPDFDQRFNRFITTMQDQIERLNTIATDFGQFGSLPKPRFARVELCSILKRIALLFTDTNSKVTFISDYEVFDFDSDEGLLQVVVTNLVKNAVQAVPHDRKAEISITLSAFENSNVEIQIVDNGNGIPAGEYQKIFTPYFTTKSQGTGIGLHLVYQIVNTLHGKVWFVSQENIGTVFYVSLPTSDRQHENENLNLPNN